MTISTAGPRPIMSEFYGDDFRWFVATVVDASPPYGLEGRVKVRIHGIHTDNTRDIPQRDLPWAQCVLPTTEGGVSGIGRIPQILAGALVFGVFVDGINSQTPLILGSLPHVEFPSNTQMEEENEGISDENRLNPETIATAAPPAALSDLDIENENRGNITGMVRNSREKTAVRFFLNTGYSLKQSISMTASLSLAAGMITGGSGIAGWNRDRYSKLKRFDRSYGEFTTQLKFIAYELRGERNGANIRLIRSDKIEGDGGGVDVFTRHYLDKPRLRAQSELAARKLQDRIGG